MATKIKLRVRRKDLLKEPDELRSFSEDAQGWFMENWPMALIAVGGVAVAIIVGVLIKSSLLNSRQKYSKDVSEAMDTFNQTYQEQIYGAINQKPGDPATQPPVTPKSFEDAAYKLEKALREKKNAPQTTVLMYYLANTYMDLGKYKEARDYYQKVSAAEGQGGSLAGIANFNAGLSLYLEKKYQEALDIFQKLVDGGDPAVRADSLVYGGHCYEQLGKFDNAIKYYQMAVDGYSDSKLTEGLDSKIKKLEMQSGKPESATTPTPKPEAATPAAMSPGK